MARLCKHDFTGGSADIWKCFDQAQRKLLYHLLEAAGFPKTILRAYSAFHEKVLYHNSISGGLGAPHRKPCSIPQGCPFSMMFTSFTFHPWIAKSKSMDVIPRGLADDLTVVAIGPNHEKEVQDGIWGDYELPAHHWREACT
jgi:Reverse transcriptase (RNA-dependent DNA polymerase).